MRSADISSQYHPYPLYLPIYQNPFYLPIYQISKQTLLPLGNSVIFSMMPTPLPFGITVRAPIANRLLRIANLLLPRSNQPEIPSDPRSILLANIANLGDAILSTTLIPILKKLYPNAKIGFLGSSLSQPAVKLHPDISRHHLFDHFYQSDLSFCKAALHHLQTFRIAKSEISGYDLAIDLQPYFPNAAQLLYAAKIPVRIGYASAGLCRYLTHPIVWNPSDGYLCNSHRNLLKACGIQIPDTPPLPSYPILKPIIPAPYLCINPAASKQEKMWPLSSWIALAKLLKKENIPTVLVGKGSSAAALCSAISQELPATNLCNQTNWADYVSIIQNATLLLSADSAAIHIAASNQVPTLAILSGINDPAVWMPPQNCTPISYPVPCAPCFQKNGCAKMDCIQKIAPEQILSLTRRAFHLMLKSKFEWSPK